MSTPDSIRREITIDAPLERVWRLISTPGWWINDGEVIEHETTTDGDLTILHWKGSDFPVRTLAVDEPRSVSYEWGSGAGASPDVQEVMSERPHTQVTMSLEQEADGVRVTVVESGFAEHPDAEQAQQTYSENSVGWDQEVAAAKAHLEG